MSLARPDYRESGRLLKEVTLYLVDDRKPLHDGLCH